MPNLDNDLAGTLEKAMEGVADAAKKNKKGGVIWPGPLFSRVIKGALAIGVVNMVGKRLGALARRNRHDG